MLIDFHTHAFPPKLAGRAVAPLSRSAGGLEPQTAGPQESLKAVMDADGVDLSVVLTNAANPGQMHKVNDYAFEMDRDDRIVAFGSVHPDAPDALEELERIKAAGLKGVKLHPEYQGFYANEERMKPIYRKISQLGLITLFHAGEDYGYPPPYHAQPEHLKHALGWFDSPVVAAHWGGAGFGREVLERLCGENIYFDLSFGYGAMPRPIAQAILDRHGPEKLLFGSDCPWHRPEWEKRLLDSLEITAEDRERIQWKNAAKLLGL